MGGRLLEKLQGALELDQKRAAVAGEQADAVERAAAANAAGLRSSIATPSPASSRGAGGGLVRSISGGFLGTAEFLAARCRKVRIPNPTNPRALLEQDLVDAWDCSEALGDSRAVFVAPSAAAGGLARSSIGSDNTPGSSTRTGGTTAPGRGTGSPAQPSAPLIAPIADLSQGAASGERRLVAAVTTAVEGAVAKAVRELGGQDDSGLLLRSVGRL